MSCCRILTSKGKGHLSLKQDWSVRVSPIPTEKATVLPIASLALHISYQLGFSLFAVSAFFFLGQSSLCLLPAFLFSGRVLLGFSFRSVVIYPWPSVSGHLIRKNK